MWWSDLTARSVFDILLLLTIYFYPRSDFTSFNPMLKQFSTSNEIMGLQTQDDIKILNNTNIVGEVCVYYERTKFLRMKKHFIVMHLEDESYVVMKWDPTGIGYHPIQNHEMHRFTAYHDSSPLLKKTKKRCYGNYSLFDLFDS